MTSTMADETGPDTGSPEDAEVGNSSCFPKGYHMMNVKHMLKDTFVLWCLRS